MNITQEYEKLVPEGGHPGLSGKKADVWASRPPGRRLSKKRGGFTRIGWGKVLHT
jgi:hypothetical protein